MDVSLTFCEASIHDASPTEICHLAKLNLITNQQYTLSVNGPNCNLAKSIRPKSTVTPTFASMRAAMLQTTKQQRQRVSMCEQTPNCSPKPPNLEHNLKNNSSDIQVY